MTHEERQRLDWLCLRIKEEQDHDKFLKLIQELNELLDRKDIRLTAAAGPSKNK